jgi:nucleotide-binding universal stress UspA family protein
VASEVGDHGTADLFTEFPRDIDRWLMERAPARRPIERREDLSVTGWTRLFCPIDFSPPSDAALQTAAELTTRLGGKLTIAHVHDVVTAPSLETPSSEEQARAKRDALTRLEEARAAAEASHPCAVETVLLAGDPAWEVAKLLKRGAYDVAVVGTHGRSGLARMLVGSVTARILRYAPCPVLVVRAPSSAEPAPEEP